MKKKRYYSLYKGDEELAFGTIEEIAKKLGVQKRTIYFYTTPTYKKRRANSKNARIMVIA